MHEHQVPDLEKPARLGLLFERGLAQAGRLRARLPLEIHEDLAARAARPGVSHLPEVVRVAKLEDPACGKAGNVMPQHPGFVIGVVNGGDDSVGMKSEIRLAGHKLPGVGNGVAFEVVAEREIPEHLEEGVVACGEPHLLEVVVFAARAHALLRRHRPVVGAGLLTQKGALELHHARIGKQQGRIVGGDQRRRRHLAVPVGDKEVEE